MNIQRILAPTDFSSCARAAVDYAIFLARTLGARVDVLHVWELPTNILPDWIVQAPGEPPQAASALVAGVASRKLELLISELRSAFENVHGANEQGDPTDTILRIAEKGAYDLIVVGTHGRSGLSKFWSGSVAEKVVRSAACPVLTLREVQAG